MLYMRDHDSFAKVFVNCLQHAISYPKGTKASDQLMRISGQMLYELNYASTAMPQHMEKVLEASDFIFQVDHAARSKP